MGQPQQQRAPAKLRAEPPIGQIIEIDPQAQGIQNECILQYIVERQN